MSEQAEAEQLKSAPEEVKSVVVNTSDSKPEMIAIRRRRKRRRSRSVAKVDPRYRRIHLALLITVAFLLIVSVTGNTVRDAFLAILVRIRDTFHGMHQMRLEVVALIIAFLILLYLTPGVEDYVLRKLGVHRSDDRR
jgi:hypothetical protein